MAEFVDVSIANPDVPIEPGSSVEVEVLVRNAGQTADSAALEVEFAEPSWVALPVAGIALEAGQSRTVRVLFKAPRSSATTSGDRPFVIRARSMETGASSAAQGTLHVRPYHAFQLEVLPQRTHVGRFDRSARYEVRLENTGNAPETFDLNITDPDNACVYTMPSERVDVPAGESVVVPLSAVPRHRPLIAPPDLFGFEMRATPLSGSAPPEHYHAQLEYRALCSPFVAFVVLLALLCGGYYLWRSQQTPEISTLTADPSEIIAGEPVKLEWTVSNATHLTMKDGTTNIQQPLDLASYYVVEHPQQSTHYTLIAGDEHGHEVRKSVDVSVSAPAAMPPPRIISFSASPATINTGHSTVLTWKVAGAQTLELAPLGRQVDPALPSLELAPSQTTKYTLIARNAQSGPVYSKPVTVVVIPPPNPAAPRINMFSVTPPGVREGEPFTLTWSVTGAAGVSISGIGAVESEGSRTFQTQKSTRFSLIATAPSGLQSEKDIRVTVLPPARIISFTGRPSSIQAGGHAQLIWNVHNADSVTIDNGIGAVPAEGTQDVSPAATATYKLTATAGGHDVAANTTITVSGSAPPP